MADGFFFFFFQGQSSDILNRHGGMLHDEIRLYNWMGTWGRLIILRLTAGLLSTAMQKKSRIALLCWTDDLYIFVLK